MVRDMMTYLQIIMYSFAAGAPRRRGRERMSRQRKLEVIQQRSTSPLGSWCG